MYRSANQEITTIFPAFQSEQPLLISDCCVYLPAQVEHQTRRRYTAEHALAAARSDLGMMPALEHRNLRITLW